MDEPTYVPALQLDKLAEALSKAQGEFQPAQESGKNPHLSTSYATLDDIIGVIRKPLANHNLSFVQLLGSNGGMTLRTILLHESGQMLESTVTIEADSGRQGGINSLQALGKSITYMKRYALSAMLGVATGGDTDGEGAPKKQTRKKTAPKKRQAATRKVKPADALDDTPTISNPADLIAALKPLEYYNHGKHALATLNKLDGTTLTNWPLDDPAFFPAVLEKLTEYANAQRALKAENAKAVISKAAKQAAF